MLMTHEHLVRELERLMDERRVRPVVRRVVRLAYGSTWEGRPFEEVSDGISWVIDLKISVRAPDGSQMRRKNPAGVAHDWFYAAGELSPLVGFGWTDSDMRAYADAWYSWALADFGFGFHAYTQWVGLRLFGGPRWRGCRRRQAETERKLIIPRQGEAR